MSIVSDIRMTLKLRREHKKIAAATERIRIEQENRIRFMNELSAAGYTIVKS